MHQKTTKTQGSLAGTAFGVIATLLMHGAFVLPVVFGGNQSASRDQKERFGFASSESVDEFSSVLILIESEAAETASGGAFAQFPELSKNPDFFMPEASAYLSTPGLDPNSFEEVDQESVFEISELADPAAMAAMFGNYTGQVAARIERAWMRPAALPASHSFICQIRIEQDRNGNVLSVELMDCDDDFDWQMSLIAAVESASPLSLPPDPSVFSKELVLKFASADSAV